MVDESDHASDNTWRPVRKPRRPRKKIRGYVFPLDVDDDKITNRKSQERYPGTRRHRHRREHKRLSYSGFELLIGFSVSWLLIITFLVVLELFSGHGIFFIAYENAPTLDSESYVIGNRAYLSDGRVVELSSIEAEIKASSIPNAPPLSAKREEVRWQRVLSVVVGVPLLLFCVSGLIRWFRRRGQDEE